METNITDALDQERTKAKAIYSKARLVVAKATNKHIIVEYLIKAAAKIDKSCWKMNPLMLLEELLPVTRVTNMVACFRDQRVTRVSQSPFLALT